MSRSGNYSMLTQAQEKLKAEGKEPNNISALRRETGLSRDTIRKYLREGVQPHKLKGTTKPSKLDEYKQLLDVQFDRGNYNCEALLPLLQSRGYRGGMTILRAYVAKYRPVQQLASRPKRTMRFETPPGFQVQMDWGCVSYVKPGRKKVNKLACLVIISGFSRKRYIEFFSAARQEFLFIGMIHAFMYFGGIAEEVLTDGMKSVVQARNKTQIVFNHKYEVFMAELGFRTKICKVRVPETKGKSERLVHYVKNNFMQGREFTNLVDLNVQALHWCEYVNDKKHGTTGMIPNEAHCEEPLRQLPQKAVTDRYLWLHRTVGIDGMLSYEGSHFGIIWNCHERRVKVNRVGSVLQAMDSRGRIVARHEIKGTKRMYFHSQQWPEDYYRSSRPPAKRYAPGIQTSHQESLVVHPIDLQEYDQLSRRQQ